MRFKDRGVVVTGGAGGIGSVIVRRFAAEGAAVLVADGEAARAAEVAAGVSGGPGRAEAFPVDVSRPEQAQAMVERARERFGRLDVLVNCAAICRADRLLEIEPEEWDRELAVDLGGVYACCRAALRPMVAQGSGSIVNITSVNGLAMFGNEAYSAAKAGVISLTNSIAVRYGPRGVRCNAVAPGTIRTPAWDERRRRDPGVMERVTRWYPAGRVGEPDDVAGPVLFLASEDAAWVSGVVLRVDGGLMSGNGPMMRELVVGSE